MALLEPADCPIWVPQLADGEAGQLAQAVIAQAQGLADAYTHRALELSAHSRLFDIAPVTRTIGLGQWPVIEDDEHEFVVTLYPDATGAVTLTAAGYDLDAAVGTVTRRGADWPEGRRIVRVQWSAGYTRATLPGDLRHALLRLVAWLLETRGGSGVKRESVDGYTVEPEEIIGGVPKSIATSLDAYRRVILG